MYKPTEAQLALRTLIKDKKRVLAYGGSRSGKTFEFCRAIIVLALLYGGRYAILRRYSSAIRTSVFNDTFPRVLELCFPDLDYEVRRSDAVIKFPHNGAEVWFVGLDDDKRVEKILGREFAALYFNECSEISYSSIEVALTRLAQRVNNLQTGVQLRNRAFFDCNPPGKSHWSYKLFVEHISPTSKVRLTNADDYGLIQINPQSNVANLPSGYIEETLANSSERMKERFLYGEFSDENENALWKSETTIDPFRVTNVPSDLTRIVIGVDPAVTSKESSDNTGIVVCGSKDSDNGETHFYVLGDFSMNAKPVEWANKVAALYDAFQADLVVAETNQGGDLVLNAIRNVSPNIPVKAVRASRGKIIRAEPISVLYAQGRVHHVGIFPDLETEMTCYTGEITEESPDRMDALVWAMTELSETNSSLETGTFYFA